jgi:hypothetical protein
MAEPRGGCIRLVSGLSGILPRGPRCTIGQRARHRSCIPLNQASGYPVTAKKRNIGPACRSLPKRLLLWSTPRSPTSKLVRRLRRVLPLPYVQGKQRWIRGWVVRERRLAPVRDRYGPMLQADPWGGEYALDINGVGHLENACICRKTPDRGP